MLDFTAVNAGIGSFTKLHIDFYIVSMCEPSIISSFVVFMFPLQTKISTILAMVCFRSLRSFPIWDGPFHSNQLSNIFCWTKLEIAFPCTSRWRHSFQNNSQEQWWNYFRTFLRNSARNSQFFVFNVCHLNDSYIFVMKFPSSKWTLGIYNKLCKPPVKSFVKSTVRSPRSSIIWTTSYFGCMCCSCLCLCQ